MDQGRGEYVRQRSSSSSGAQLPASPLNYRNFRSGSTPSMKRPQAKAAAQRLAQVMASRGGGDGDEDDADQEDDLMYQGGGATGSIGLGGGTRHHRSPMTVSSSRASPMASPNRPASLRLTPGVASPSPRDQQHRTPSSLPSSTPNAWESARSAMTLRSPHNQPASARAISYLGGKMVPPSVSMSRKPPGAESTPDNTTYNNINRRDRRLSVDIGSISSRESSSQRSNCVMQDELDMLQEENESLLEKLRLAEERIDEAEERARQLEKQVANLGEGVTLEARLLSRKEAALQQREVALRVAAAQTYEVKTEEIAALRMEAETAREETSSALEHLHEAECENRAIRKMVQRLILTREEMEEVILKRCWLARYWNLSFQYGVYSEIAGARNEYWSTVAPRPFEVVLSAGQRAKKSSEQMERNEAEERAQVLEDINHNLSGEGNVENMIVVEKGLRELASLKVGDAVALAMAKKGRPALTDYLKLPVEGQVEAFELSQDEADDVRFKQAWLAYYWRRAKAHGLEEDIVDERLQFWTNHRSHYPSSHDAVDVERGLAELRILGIEIQLWEDSRRGLELACINPRNQTEF